MVRSKNDTGRRLAVRIAMGCQIGALPCTPFASSRRSPQGETRSMERKNRESYISCTIPQFPPLVVNAVSQSPECLSCPMTLKVNPVTLLASPLGEEGHEVAKGCTRVRIIMILDVDVTAEGGIIKLIARRAIPQPSGPKAPSNLRTLRPIGPVNPKNLPL
mgnify:CR=1 FL=1